jgi:NADP-dependent 3-hydroxy acid dehydrogenase YdfG
MSQKRNWRRKAIQNRYGEMVAVSDHWQLLDIKGRMLGEIYKSHDSEQWIWTVNVNLKGLQLVLAALRQMARKPKVMLRAKYL